MLKRFLTARLRAKVAEFNRVIDNCTDSLSRPNQPAEWVEALKRIVRWRSFWRDFALWRARRIGITLTA